MMPTGMAVAGDRSVYASGISAIPPTFAAMTVKYSPSGVKLWKKAYAGPAGLGALAWGAVARPGGGVYVCGTAISGGTGGDGLVMGYTAGGVRDVFALDTGPGGASEQRFDDLTVTSTDQVVAVGFKYGRAATRTCTPQPIRSTGRSPVRSRCLEPGTTSSWRWPVTPSAGSTRPAATTPQ